MLFCLARKIVKAIKFTENKIAGNISVIFKKADDATTKIAIAKQMIGILGIFNFFIAIIASKNTIKKIAPNHQGEPRKIVSQFFAIFFSTFSVSPFTMFYLLLKE